MRSQIGTVRLFETFAKLAYFESEQGEWGLWEPQTFVSDNGEGPLGGDARPGPIDVRDDQGAEGGLAVGDHSYLIRYGAMRHVGRFSALTDRDTSLERGQLVVIQTDRGVELGEVLIALDGQSAVGRNGPGDTTSRAVGEERMDSDCIDSSRVLRLAGADDLSLARSAEELRSSRFSLCQRILREGNWPWELIDVEPLLDGHATVLHYLGPHQLDVASLRARFRVEFDIDVVLEPVGNDLDGQISAGDAHDDGKGGGCGSCGSSDGGGCGSAPASVPAADHLPAKLPRVGARPRSHSGCSSCGISRLLAQRSQART